MPEYIMSVELITDALIGSGEGYGAIVDSDIVYDDLGIPYIPGKRMKGLLLDSAFEIIDNFNQAGLISYIAQARNTDDLFGKAGDNAPSPLSIFRFNIENYETTREWLKYFIGEEKYGKFISPEMILKTFTGIRRQTKIVDGIASDGSLRTIRVVNKGTIFYGKITLNSNNPDHEKLFSLACINLRRLGTKRNRGLGEVVCTLQNDVNLNTKTLHELEAVCTK